MTQNFSSNNKRIAKNTMLLYFRMLLTMIVSLYTSRIILKSLGVNDFGIYNVVGGVVAMFNMLSGSLSAAISRFITYEIGTRDKYKLKKIFSSALTIQFGLGLIMMLLTETIGVWFLNSKMNIPDNRIYAANCVLQFSIITFIISLISIPYNATIIAHERMSAFAYISLIEAVGKLIIAFLIAISPIDKLIVYSILMCMIAIIIRFIYGIYCKKHFEECTYTFIFDKELLKQMFSFASWNFIGSTSSILRDHGGNIIINLFFGPAVNASRGIANQVNAAVQSFVANFMTALNPQITKTYASGEIEYMNKLLFIGARFSFYILLIITLPILLNTEYLLRLWLNQVPEHGVSFVQLVLVLTLSESISTPLITAMLATGNIKKYQIVVGGIQMINIPLSYMLLKMGGQVEIVYFVAIFLSFACLGARLILLRTMIDLNPKKFITQVIQNIIEVSIAAAIIPFFLFISLESNFGNFFISCVTSIILTIISIAYVGLNKKERSYATKQLIIIYKNRIKHEAQ